jgi:hypothetical protein
MAAAVMTEALRHGGQRLSAQVVDESIQQGHQQQRMQHAMGVADRWQMYLVRWWLMSHVDMWRLGCVSRELMWQGCNMFTSMACMPAQRSSPCCPCCTHLTPLGDGLGVRHPHDGRPCTMACVAEHRHISAVQHSSSRNRGRDACSWSSQHRWDMPCSRCRAARSLQGLRSAQAAPRTPGAA